LSLCLDFKCAADPVEFARARLGFEPDEVQQALLRSRAKRGLLNCTRQWGKSTTTAAMAVHELMYARDPLVVIASPGARQSNELRRKVEYFLGRLGGSVQFAHRGDDGFDLRNGARLVVLPGQESTVRGVSACTLLLVDEASRVKDDLRRALNPFLAVRDGRAWELSTPFGKRGFFWEHWSQGGDEWERIRVPASECPRISPAFLARERKDLGEWWFLQEYCCEFVDVAGSVFNHESVLGSVSAEVRPLWD
jgi:hypothetical protein